MVVTDQMQRAMNQQSEQLQVEIPGTLPLETRPSKAIGSLPTRGIDGNDDVPQGARKRSGEAIRIL